MQKSEAIAAVLTELSKAVQKHKAMTTPHDGYAVILEELDELWDEVRVKQAKHSRERMRAEATQIAAMAVRFMMDLT